MQRKIVKKTKICNKCIEIAVFVKSHLSKLFSPVYSDDEDTGWVKIKKEVVRADRDIYIGTHYMSPSATAADKTTKLMENIAFFQSKDVVLVNGDFNARTGSDNNTISPDKFDNEFGLEIEEICSKRNSQDNTINKQGEDLLNMCKSLDLCKTCDPFGNYTCIKWNGNSVVVYLLISKSIFDQVPIFKVGQYQPMLSDHCPLQYCFEIPRNLNGIKEESTLNKAPRNFSWSDNGIAKFLANLKSANNQKDLCSILESDFSDTNIIVEYLTDLLTKTAEKS